MNFKSLNKDFSLIRNLKKQNRLSYDLEVLLNSLTLEEIIALKLELSSKAVGHKLYGFPIWFSIQDIVKEAVLIFAMSATKTKGEASRLLGLTPKYLRQLTKKYNLNNYINGGDLDSTG